MKKLQLLLESYKHHTALYYYDYCENINSCV